MSYDPLRLSPRLKILTRVKTGEKYMARMLMEGREGVLIFFLKNKVQRWVRKRASEKSQVQLDECEKISSPTVGEASPGL